MKTNIKHLALLAMAIFSISLAKAQCPTIKNDMACNIDVSYVVLDCNNNPCGGPMTLQVIAYQAVQLTCACSPFCNIVVTLQNVAGTPVGGPTANMTVAAPGNSFSTPVSCGGTTAAIWYDSSITEFVVK